jgi:hypothetical protein
MEKMMSDNLLPPEVPSRETIARAIWAVKPDCQGKPFPLDTMTPKERRGYDHNPIASLDLCFTYADAALASIPAARSASWREALFPPDFVEDGGKCITTLDASYNLQGALYDLKQLASKGKPADKICIDTIERVVAQLEQARAAPLPSPAATPAAEAGPPNAETVQILLDLLNPLHGELDRQTYDQKRENFDAPGDAEWSVNITARMERDLTQAVLILENRLRDPQIPSPAGSVAEDELRWWLSEQPYKASDLAKRLLAKFDVRRRA